MIRSQEAFDLFCKYWKPADPELFTAQYYEMWEDAFLAGAEWQRQQYKKQGKGITLTEIFDYLGWD